MALAKWWGVTPMAFAGATMRDLIAMAEFRDKVIEYEKEAAERAKYGLRVDEDVRRFKGRGPKKTDTFVTGSPNDDW